jgi:hypothetical protein
MLRRSTRLANKTTTYWFPDQTAISAGKGWRALATTTDDYLIRWHKMYREHMECKDDPINF